MALVAGDLYIALRDAGIGEEKARKAAEEALSISRRPSGAWFAPTAPVQVRMGGVGNMILAYMLGIATGLAAVFVLVR